MTRRAEKITTPHHTKKGDADGDLPVKRKASGLKQLEDGFDEAKELGSQLDDLQSLMPAIKVSLAQCRRSSSSCCRDQGLTSIFPF